MVFITVANSKRILSKIDLKKLNLAGKIYDSPIYFFNKREEQSLLAYKELLMNPERFVKEVYQKAEIRDSYMYVYEGETPCYHKTKDCERLTAEFCNFLIPKEIKERGTGTVRRFRAWFKSNRSLLEGKEEVFEMRVSAAFGVRLRIEELAPRKNSGVIAMNNWSLEELESRISEMLKQARQYYYQSSKNTAILKQYGKLAYLGNSPNQIINNRTGYSDAEVKTFLRDYEEKFKQPIIAMLYDYYRMKFNPELALGVKLLEQLGFRACHSCFF
ncbi:hypothetical protein [Bacteroides oleiciplenus]|uniref:Uncharacterized protein n=2 Tax=Bacteroides oleiciplenus TaxID=626931 RepID=K9DSQ2_9BACE|nr:hypothetical protein [Bacteroides oleiciplenus]EKU87453.1 hypothetical protein HMPREF9447_05336 [Bacteroides oleiciplenus YIT 12058]RGN32994.1 hypothetical protein DXB65_17385 [Bacteroides oleiciplenus]